MVNETPAKVAGHGSLRVWRGGALMTLPLTAVQLNTEGLTTTTGAPWSANTGAKVQKRLQRTLSELPSNGGGPESSVTCPVSVPARECLFSVR
jgi:hypothetical protein